MAVRKSFRRAVPPILLLMVVTLLPSTGSAQPTRSQVDAACADSREQLDEYRSAQAEFERSVTAHDRVLADIERLERQQNRIQNSVDTSQDAMALVQTQIEKQAVELYMRAGFSAPGIILSASSVDKLLTTTEFLSSATLGGQQSINDLLASRGELARFQNELQNTHDDMRNAQEEAASLVMDQSRAMEREQAAYQRLSERCRTLNAEYEAEQARLREEERRRRQAEENRRRGSIQTGPFICPFTPGRTSFIDSWGHPRSGGRTHKGTDLMAAWNEPMYAVQAGTVLHTHSPLGGISIWLRADTGIAYYYAHLATRTTVNGQRVTQGQMIGTNGDTGNARGGPPHLHFQMHPGGMNTPAVNPYPTLIAACRR